MSIGFEDSKIRKVLGIVLLLIAILLLSDAFKGVYAYNGDYWIFIDRKGADTHIYSFNNTIVNDTVSFLGFTPDTSNENLWAYQNKPYVMLKDGGNITIYYLANREGVNGIWLYNSTDGGNTFNAMFQVKSGNQLGCAIGYSENTNMLHFAYGRNEDVYYSGNYSLTTKTLTQDAKVIVDGDNVFLGYTMVVDDNDNLFFMSCAGSLGINQPYYQFHQRVNNTWTGTYTWTNGGLRDITQCLAQYDNIRNRLIVTCFTGSGNDAVYAAYKNLTIAHNTGWNGFTQISDANLDGGFHFMGYDELQERIKCTQTYNDGVNNRAVMIISNYPFNSGNTYHNQNYTGESMTEPLLFDRHEWLQDKLLATLTTNNPDLGVIMNEGYTQTGDYTVDGWIKNTNSFSFQNDTTNIWTVFEQANLNPIDYPEDYPEPLNETLESNNRGECNYLFVNELYKLSIVWNNTEYFEIKFNDTLNKIVVKYNVTSNELNINDINDYIFSIDDFTINQINTYTYMEMYFSLGKNILDANDVTFTTYQNNSFIGVNSTLGITRNIYNLGGLMEYEFINDANKVWGGDVFEIESQYNASFSFADVESAYRKLQHVHLQASLDVSDNDVYDTVENTGQFKYGIRICENNTWVDQYYCLVNINKGAVDAGGVGGTGKAWVTLRVQWYAINNTGIEWLIKTDYITAYPDCGDDVSKPVKTLKFWVDLWFSKYNNSEIIAGRFTPYYYGIEQNGHTFWTDWAPLSFNETSSMFFFTNYDSNGNKRITTDIEMIKVFARLETADNADTNLWALRNYEIFSIETATDRFEGIDTPVFEPPKVPDMPSGGFVAPIVKALQSLGNLITKAIISLIGGLGGIIDDILRRLGLPPIMHIFYTLIKGLFDILEPLYQNLTEIVISLVTSIGNVFNSLFLVIPRYVYFITMVVGVFVNYYNIIVSFFTSGFDGITNLWSQYDIYQFIQLYIAVILPFIEIARIESSDTPIQTLVDDLKTVRDIIMGAFTFLWSLISIISEIIGRIIGVI
jgi:hypothetical protein